MTLKTLIKKIIKEETEEWVDVSPEEYKELLTYIGDAADIKKLKEYRGKKIRITGNLDLSRRKDIENLDSIDFVDGNLNVDHSNIKYFDKNKVKGVFSYWYSEMYHEKLRKVRQLRLEQLDELRESGEWDVNNNDDISNETEALFKHLISEGVVEEGEDKYFIFPQFRNQYVGQYIWLGSKATDQTFQVYDDNNIFEAAKNDLQNTVDELGYEAFRSDVWDSFVDEDEARKWLYDDFESTVRDSPEDYGVGRELTQEQKRYIEIYQSKIGKLNKKLEDGGSTDEEVEEIKNDIYDYERLIEDFKGNPEGDYDEDQIENAIEDFVDGEIENFPRYMKNMGFEDDKILEFIDMDDLFKYVINSDGYAQILNRYDGRDDEYLVNSKWYHVMREN